MASNEDRLWSRDYALLAQGQAVSCLGSTLYSVIASLWVYDLTGSTLLMSAVYSAAHIARLIAFPFAGMIVDRFPRRDLVVVCDLLSGGAMLAVAGAAAWGKASAVWVLVAYSALSGACSGVFNPSVNALMLAISNRKHFVRANSVYNAIEYGIDVLGQGVAGSLYLLLGAPVMFLINGLSFLFSAGTELFITRDEKPVHREKVPFWRDATEGVQYILKNPGIRLNLLLAFLINFAFGVQRVVLVPWMMSFGTECFGLLGSFRSAGVLAGTLLLAARSIPEKRQYGFYFGCQVAFIACIAAAAWVPSFWGVALLFCVAYANQYVFNTLQRSAVIINAPNELRGKVLCAVQALAMGFSAAGNLAGGVLCEFIPPQPLVFGLMAALLAAVWAFGRRQAVKDLFAVSTEEH